MLQTDLIFIYKNNNLLKTSKPSEELVDFDVNKPY